MSESDQGSDTPTTTPADSVKPVENAIVTPSTPTTTAPKQTQAKIAANVKKVVTIISPQTEVHGADFKELVVSTPNQRNWRGILIALLVILAVLGLILFSIVLLSPPDNGPRAKGEKLTIEDIAGRGLVRRPFNGTWVSDSEVAFRDSAGGVTLFSALNSTTRPLMSNSAFRQLNAMDYSISADLKFVLILSGVKKVLKYSIEATYYIYEEANKSVDALLLLPGSEVAALEESGSPVQLVRWSPSGHSLVFVIENDIFYRVSPRSPKIYRVTNTGKPGTIFNGVPDWLYEEEILQTSSTLWFSPDGQHIMFLTINDTEVGEMRYPWYSTPDGARLKYPRIRSQRYPKAGTNNPAVQMWVANISTPEKISLSELKPSEAILGEHPGDHYLTSAQWLTTSSVALTWMNRSQNISVVSICKSPDWQCKDTYTERSKWWIPMPGKDRALGPLFSSDNQWFVLVTSVPGSGTTGPYRHACLVQTSTGLITTELTQGEWEVTNLLAWDSELRAIYLIGTGENRPGQRHLYRVHDPIGDQTTIECLTCNCSVNITSALSNGTGCASEQCTYSWAWLSPAAPAQVAQAEGVQHRWAVLECLGPAPPRAHLLDLAVPATALSETGTVDGAGGRMRQTLSRLALPQALTFQVKLPGDFQARVRLLLPPGFRHHEEDFAFPLVLHVLGEPDSQLVSDRFKIDWNSYLASRRNFIVAEIDGRGSGFQGDLLRHQINQRLGDVEIRDQIAVIQYLRENLKFIDRQRIAVWGWSYGGFASAMVLAQDQGMFNCGIAVAPIASWNHYDSVFSERYLGAPKGNVLAYETCDLTKRAGNLSGKQFLLIHGTADRKAHYQQSMLLVRALADQGVLFRHQTYPDEDHDLAGVQNHLYRAMDNFLDDCFGPLNFEEWENTGTSIFSSFKP